MVNVPGGCLDNLVLKSILLASYATTVTKKIRSCHLPTQNIITQIRSLCFEHGLKGLAWNGLWSSVTSLPMALFHPSYTVLLEEPGTHRTHPCFRVFDLATLSAWNSLPPGPYGMLTHFCQICIEQHFLNKPYVPVNLVSPHLQFSVLGNLFLFLLDTSLTHHVLPLYLPYYHFPPTIRQNASFTKEGSCLCFVHCSLPSTL